MEVSSNHPPTSILQGLLKSPKVNIFFKDKKNTKKNAQ